MEKESTFGKMETDTKDNIKMGKDGVSVGWNGQKFLINLNNFKIKNIQIIKNNRFGKSGTHIKDTGREEFLHSLLLESTLNKMMSQVQF